MLNKRTKIVAVWPYHKTSFSTHNEVMKQFRRSHGRIAMVNQTSANNHSALAETAPLAIKRVNVDGGGSHLPAQISSLRTSLSLPKVASYKISPN
jgi:hypothetical protein